MDKCPPEIHARIFQFACTDDGITGCSLSLVSKYIKEVSSSYRWQCVVLSCYKRILQFAELVRYTKQNRPIHHLFLSDRHSPPPYSFIDPEITYDTQIPPAFLVILKYASPTLDTLTFYSDAVYFYGASASSFLLGVSFPKLTELTIRARCTPRQITTVTEDIQRMPSLRRLHLALPYHGFENENLRGTHVTVSSLSPTSGITHLRLSMLDKWGSRRVVEVLHAELAASGVVPSTLNLPASNWDGPLTTTARTVSWENILPNTLQQLIIQPSPTSTFYCSCCMDLRGDVNVMRILHELAERADPGYFLYLERRPILVRRCRSDPMDVIGYGYKEARLDWLERVQDGLGCWQQREDAFFDHEEEEEEESEDQRELEPVPPPLKSRGTSRMPVRVRNIFRSLRFW